MVNYSDPHAFRRSDDPTKWHFPPRIDGLPEKPLPPGPKTLFSFQQIDTPSQRVRTAGYYNAVQRLDDGIGMLMEVLGEHNHLGDTLLIFVGDHGPPFARGKTTVYESGIRVPFLVHWPGVSKPMRSSAMVSTIDILPTILDATGVAYEETLHGKSLRPVVQDAESPWRDYLVAEFHFHGGRPFYPRRAIRDHRYKLIHNLLAGSAKPSTRIDGDPAYGVSRESRYDGTPVRQAFDTFADPPEYELYDLQMDPFEFQNVAGNPEYKEIQKRLMRALIEYRNQTNDPFRDSAFLKEFSQRYESPATK
jgi:N-sulfoglucosamine sulfohydrolase